MAYTALHKERVMAGSTTMPVKLMIVVALMALGIAGSLYVGALVTAGINVALLVGVLVGNDGVRRFLRGLAALYLLWGLIVMFATAAYVLWSPAWTIMLLLGVASPAFTFWALGQDDTREWMFRKNFKLDETV